MDPTHDNLALGSLLTGRMKYWRDVLEVGIEVRIDQKIQLLLKLCPTIFILKEVGLPEIVSLTAYDWAKRQTFTLEGLCLFVLYCHQEMAWRS
jgi:hypothetical protein